MTREQAAANVPAGDELIHVLDGGATLELVCDDGQPWRDPAGA